MNVPLIIAHTGCEGTPDNTLESCLAGWDAGADVLEVDVQATKDGVCVLHHDDHPAFSSCTYEELVEENPLRLEAGKRLVKLEDVLVRFKRTTASFNLDIKNDAAALPAVKLLETLDMWEQIYFTGATDRIVKTPFRARVMRNTPESLSELGSAVYEAAAEEICTRAKQAGCAGINADFPSCRDSLVRIAHEYGLRVWIYTLQDVGGLKAFADMGVDAVSVLDVSGASALRRQWAPDRELR
ncbi:glycerophosphodiester phosphodiesterase [Paenibacillus sp. VCA1]|uniref:glycerophosphodiester phosphodiesterase n=1 Tax=Paenibacillus sp. VCA1 TaxID=3039148 RepID=UPI002872068E|nr:glycerophosphodiester phosphodiesterase [Paenibacillus sp. VCA1]MDR9856264.1 glycerophosphodiester phosphodiesterase [Paenibacillus sp. VCA1]